MGRERRRRPSRSPRPAPGQPVAPGGDGEASTSAATPGSARAARLAARRTGGEGVAAGVRSERILVRESANMVDELKRVAGVSAVCFGMLVVLVVVDRLT